MDAFRHSGLYPANVVGWTTNSDPKCAVPGPWIINPSSNPTNGYFFEYSGRVPSTTTEGCTRFKKFTMSARPVAFGKTGVRSFFVDESMGFHATSDNRPANEMDPIDSTLLHRP